jgi:hypothetical protein
LPAIISYGVNLPALFRPGRPLTVAELAGDAEKAKADRTELEESRTALLDARQQIATLTRQVARLEKAAPQGEKAAPKTTTKGRRNGTRIEVIPESAPRA